MDKWAFVWSVGAHGSLFSGGRRLNTRRCVQSSLPLFASVPRHLECSADDLFPLSVEFRRGTPMPGLSYSLKSSIARLAGIEARHSPQLPVFDRRKNNEGPTIIQSVPFKPFLRSKCSPAAPAPMRENGTAATENQTAGTLQAQGATASAYHNSVLVIGLRPSSLLSARRDIRFLSSFSSSFSSNTDPMCPL